MNKDNNELTYDKTFEHWLQEKNYVNDGWTRFEGCRTEEFRNGEHRARKLNKSCFADQPMIELSESNRNTKFTKKTLNREFSFMLWGALFLRDELQKLKKEFKHLSANYIARGRHRDELEKENKELKAELEKLKNAQKAT